MPGKFSMPRFPQEDLESTQELPQLPQDFEPLDEPVIEYSTVPDNDDVLAYDGEADYNPDEELPEDFIDVALRVVRDLPGFFKTHQKQVLLACCAVFLAVILVAVGSFAMKARDPYDEKILNNLVVVDVLVGGMTKEQATATLNANLASRYAAESMVLELGEETILLSPADTGAKFNVQAAVDAAYAFGRTGTEEEREAAYQTSLSGNYVIAALPYLDLNKDYIRKTLQAVEDAHVSQLTQSSYTLDGEVDSFSTEDFNPAASGQELVITLGTPQVEFDSQALYETVLDHYSLAQFRVADPGPVTIQEPEPLDLEAIYQEFYLECVDPTLDMSSFKTIPGSYGREFDLASAGQLLSEANYGDTIHIPMTYPAPEGDPESVLFRDVLGEFRTTLPDDEHWNQNVKLACKTISGITLKPGETFSFNAVLGQPSESRGYREVPSCSGEELTGNIGGGVCQAASTIYVAAVLSDMEILARAAHDAPVSYIEKGMDADASWDGPDFSFRNSSIYPIRLETEASGGYVKVKIIGTDMRNYTTDMEVAVSETIQPKIIYKEFDFDNEDGYEDGDIIQDGVNGYKVKTYKRKYDKNSQDLLSRDFVTNSTYASRDKIIARVAPEVTEIPTAPPSETVSGVDENVEAVG